jgi:hypothetical protein
MHSIHLPSSSAGSPLRPLLEKEIFTKEKFFEMGKVGSCDIYSNLCCSQIAAKESMLKGHT